MYKVYFHIDESENAWLDGLYGTWEQALIRHQELLKYYPRVDIFYQGHRLA
jgi:hypothetical protein